MPNAERAAGRDESDFVIVGAGTAGALLAARLAEAGAGRVTVVEAGPMDRSPWIHLPIGFFRTLRDPRINWDFTALYDEAEDAREMRWPRGRVVGGSGSINGLVYIQGQRQDYADWAALAGPEWGWPAVGPRFEALRAAGMVSSPRWSHPLVDAFIRSAVRLGHAENDGFNGPRQAGVGYFHLNTRHGLRASTARRFLHPALRRGRLALICGALVDRIIVEQGRAVGIRYLRDGAVHELRARREVILAAGAIGSPLILQRSGLGPAALLQAAGIAVHRDLPEVGRNLRDHYAVRTVHRVRGLRTLNDMSHSLLAKAAMGLQYGLARRGPLTIGAAVAGLFAALAEPGGRPEVQFLMGPLSTDNPAEGLHGWPGMTLTYTQSYPRSAGWLGVTGPDPQARPRIVANYLADPQDREIVVRAMALARRLVAEPPLARHIEREYLPGPQVRRPDEVLDYARRSGGTVYHPCGTVRMGLDAGAPLDPRLRLRGVAGLRVADASAMPAITSGNINAVCAMIGEAAAEFILAGG